MCHIYLRSVQMNKGTCQLLLAGTGVSICQPKKSQHICSETEQCKVAPGCKECASNGTARADVGLWWHPVQSEGGPGEERKGVHPKKNF